MGVISEMRTNSGVRITTLSHGMLGTRLATSPAQVADRAMLTVSLPNRIVVIRVSSRASSQPTRRPAPWLRANHSRSTFCREKNAISVPEKKKEAAKNSTMAAGVHRPTSTAPPVANTLIAV